MNDLSKAFRPSLTREQLEIIQEALVFYAKKLESEWKGQPFREYNKLLLTQKLCYNLKLFLDGEKKTGRRRKFQPWKDKL